MTLKSYLTAMILATTICWGIFLFVLLSVNPETTNWLGFLLFYLSLFLSLSGSAAIIGFIVRFVALKRELAFRAVIIAFRQSFLFAFLIVATLFLLAKDLFTWFNLFLLIIGLTILEYFLINYKSRNMKHISANDNEDNYNQNNQYNSTH